jgi:adenine C2-methylase RlmN of 23S rRNA A2503 and tRNA A37
MKPITETNGPQVRKVLFDMGDRNNVEAVYMNFKGGHTSLCISTQIGCAMNCNFCATGAGE